MFIFTKMGTLHYVQIIQCVVNFKGRIELEFLAQKSVAYNNLLVVGRREMCLRSHSLYHGHTFSDFRLCIGRS